VNPGSEPTIKDFRCFPADELYALFADVYASSDAMSEVLADKYPDAQSLAKDAAALAGTPGAVALAVEIGHGPEAYAIVRPRKPARLRHTAELAMGVAREARGHGLGKFVLQATLDRVRAESLIEIVYLMVRADNGPAIRLYEKAGFAALAVLERDTRIGDAYFDGILMRRFMR
jgi:RimJ/RimL family protein N-acetyltransferase